MVTQNTADLSASQPAILDHDGAEYAVLRVKLDCAKPSPEHNRHAVGQQLCLGQCGCGDLADVAIDANRTRAVTAG